MIKVSDIITPHFRAFWVASKKKQHLRYVLKGGRGSGKSFHIPLRIALDLIEYPVSALIMRKVQNTVQKSVFQQVKQATKVLGVDHLFRFVPSKLEITYTSRGNKIYFAGADDPDKIKSLKDAEFPIAILWIEELAEFKTEDEVTTIENSILREELKDKVQSEAEERKRKYGFDYSFYYSYNPPKRKQNWCNKKFETQFIGSNTFVDHSTYLDNPYLSERFIEEAENVKAKNIMKYEWEYLGKPIGSGIVPFDNLVFRTITDEEMDTFDNIRQGIDWGYAADPFAFVRWHYDRMRRRIYCLDEIYQVKMSNREAAEEITKRGYDWLLTLADSAEPKSVAELDEYGIKIEGVKKVPGSVEYGEKWLDDLEEIVIDPKRTPNTAREFESIDYMTDKDGNLRSRLEDKDNHTIDSTRYAMFNDMSGDYEPERVALPSIGGVAIKR